MSEYISPSEAQDFYLNGLRELDNLLIGEKQAKIGMLVTMASGLNMVLVGDPGGGKTTLARESYRLVDGIESEDIAMVPPQADLTAMQLVPNKITTTKTITTEESTYSETNTMDMEPLITPLTKVIFANEINRIAPHALNAILEAYESRVLDTNLGSMPLDFLEYGVSTMNHADTHQAVFNISAAMASRHAIGAEMGSDEETDRAIIEAVGTNWKSEPGKMSPVVDISTLHAIRHRANEGIAIPGNLWKEYATPRILEVKKGLELHRVHDATGRLAERIKLVAKTHATLNGQDKIEEQDIDMAAQATIVARLGILGVSATRIDGQNVKLTATQVSRRILNQ